MFEGVIEPNRLPDTCKRYYHVTLKLNISTANITVMAKWIIADSCEEAIQIAIATYHPEFIVLSAELVPDDLPCVF